MLDKIKATAAYIKHKTHFAPEAGIVLDFGLGGLAAEIDVQDMLAYTTIPHFPVSTVAGHAGNLIFGSLGGKKVVALQGRFHFYEGYTMQQVAFPVQVMRELGVKRLILSNASGGLNPDYRVGDIVFINDHINLFPTNPLMGKNHDELGPRFLDMSAPYDAEMVRLARKIADKHGVRSHTGVYAGVPGPCFESPAECRYLRIIGADIVGMSTVPEVIAARHGGVTCFALSVVTDIGSIDKPQKISHEEVLAAAVASEKKMTGIITELLLEL